RRAQDGGSEKVNSSQVSLLTQKILLEVQTKLPSVVERALRAALKREKSKLARLQLKTILDNVALAQKEKLPICQDTGFLEFFVEADKDFASIEKGIRDGVRKALKKIPLRPNSVDALTRKPLQANEPIIHFIPSRAKRARLTLFVKGAGSENQTGVFMLPPTSQKIEDCVILFVKNHASRACPPVFVGVGIGGNAERALALAKKALLRENEQSRNFANAALEKRLLTEINALGIGVMGLGGSTTALGVRVETAPTHTACLPVAVTLNCWALRKASARLK
ncbi:MAG: fumarate hydratase, partial [Candidatus Micrarchaeota archaeon]